MTMNFENLSAEELEERIEWYEDRGWESNLEAAKERLHQVKEDVDSEEMDVPEELKEAPEGMEAAHLRCSIQNE